uniref:Uncharacterized protein n=1 Tax=Ditylenchus dipsaci TaxID=166011 RepID=A0A915EFI7_9BILA
MPCRLLKLARISGGKFDEKRKSDSYEEACCFDSDAEFKLWFDIEKTNWKSVGVKDLQALKTRTMCASITGRKTTGAQKATCPISA